MRIRRRWRRRIRAGAVVVAAATTVALVIALFPDHTTVAPRAEPQLAIESNAISSISAQQPPASQLIVDDRVAPEVTITIGARSPNGHSVEVPFTATATDDQTEPIRAMCVPASGSLFKVGTTPISCTATDAAGNTGVARADVVVIDGSADAPTAQTPATDPTRTSTADRSRRLVAAFGFGALGLAFVGGGIRRRRRHAQPIHLAPAVAPVPDQPLAPPIMAHRSGFDRVERNRQSVNSSVDFRWLAEPGETFQPPKQTFSLIIESHDDETDGDGKVYPVPDTLASLRFSADRELLSTGH